MDFLAAVWVEDILAADIQEAAVVIQEAAVVIQAAVAAILSRAAAIQAVDRPTAATLRKMNR